MIKIPIIFRLLYMLLSLVEVLILVNSTIPTVLIIILSIGVIVFSTAWFVTGQLKYLSALCILYIIIAFSMISFKTPSNIEITDSTTEETYSYSEDLFSK